MIIYNHCGSCYLELAVAYFPEGGVTGAAVALCRFSGQVFPQFHSLYINAFNSADKLSTGKSALKAIHCNCLLHPADSAICSLPIFVLL